MREVLLTGSVPRETVEEVYRDVSARVGDLLRRMPDGEVGGWGGGGIAGAVDHPLLRPGEPTVMTTSDSPFGQMPPMAIFYPKDGVDPAKVELPPSGVAQLKLASYHDFTRLKDEGVISRDMRFQFTTPGPATTAGVIGLRHDLLLPAAERMLNAEIDEILAAIPASELTVQLDLAVELEMEELRRRPDAFSTPVFVEMDAAWGDWTYQDVAASVARIANRVPRDVELGFHLCGMWHIDPRGGQDMKVHVDFANALIERVDRPITYIHVASVPEHGEGDYRTLTGMNRGPETKLFIGLVHSRDGIEGTARRVRAAEAAGLDFGVAHFCGIAPLFGVQPNELDDVLDLHRQAAEV